MRITPLDVRKQEFRRGMRGYDNDEVRAFLTNLADEYEAVLMDNKQLRERILEQDDKLGEYRHLETTLRDTLMTAEKVMQEAKDNARRESDVLVQEARQRVNQTLAAGRAQLDELRREALAVHREKETYLSRFRSLAEAQIHFVESHRQDFTDLDGRLLDSMPENTGKTNTVYPPPAATVQRRPEGGDGPPVDLPPSADSDTGPAASVERPRSEPDRWRDYEPGSPVDKGRDSSSERSPGNVTEDEIERVAAAVEQADSKIVPAGPLVAPVPPAEPVLGADPAPEVRPGGPNRVEIESKQEAEKLRPAVVKPWTGGI